MPENSQTSSTCNSLGVCCQCLDSGASLCQTLSCSSCARLAHPSHEVCHEGSRSVLQPPPSVLLPPANAPPPQQSSPLLSHLRHVQPRSVYLTADPELGLIAWQSSELVRSFSLVTPSTLSFLNPNTSQRWCFSLAIQERVLTMTLPCRNRLSHPEGLQSLECKHYHKSYT